jgi:putative inorganic carbon (HCO3(-)) transporter
LKQYNPPIEEFYFLKIKNMWRYFRGQHFSFWMICFYLFFEYTRPQAIFPSIDFLPWAQIFLIGSLVGAFADPSVKWVSSPVNVFITMFAIVIFASSLNAYYPETSKENYINFYGWFVVYFLIINIVNTKQRFYIFLMIFILSAAKISIGTSKTFALRGFSFTGWGLSGPSGFFQNSGELAILMLTLFPLTFLLYQYLKNKIGKWERMLLILFWVTPVLTILGSSSRGAQLALCILLLIMFRKSIFRLKPLIILLTLSLSLFYMLPDEQKLRFNEIGEDTTSKQRQLYWENGMEMMNKHPFLGVGFFNFPQYYTNYYPGDMLYDKAELPHNIFIQVGTDAGYIGLITFLFLLALPFLLSRRILKSHNKDDFLSVSIAGVLYGVIGFTIAGQFVTVTYYPFIWISLSLIVTGLNVNKLSHKRHTLKIK